MSEGQPSKPLNRFEYVPLATFLCQFHKVSDVRFINPFSGMVHAHDVARKTVLGVDVAVDNVPWVHGQAVSSTLQPNAIRNSPQPPDPFVNPRTQAAMEHDVNGRGVCIYGVTCRRYWLLRETPRGEAPTGAFGAGGFPTSGAVPLPGGAGEGNDVLKCAVRLNFQHQHMAQLQDTAAQQKLFAAAGAEHGGFAVLSETGPDGADINELPMRELEFGMQNEQYTKTMMLVDESNLWNGIVTIPEEVCRASRLPVWAGEAPAPDERMLDKLMASMKIDPATEAGQQEKQSLIHKFKRDFEESFRDYERSTFCYAVPKKHVLAWGFSSEAYMDMHDVRVEKFRFVHADTKKVKLLYYLVPNKPFERFVEYFKRDLMGKTDRRPLSSVGFEFVPRVPPSAFGGGGDQGGSATVPPGLFGNGVAPPPLAGGQLASIRLRAYISYYSVPTSLSAGTIKCLAPTLCKGFPLPHNWSEDEVARQIAIEEAMLGQKGKKFNK